jgi:hypothetical protein
LEARSTTRPFVNERKNALDAFPGDEWLPLIFVRPEKSEALKGNRQLERGDKGR